MPDNNGNNQNNNDDDEYEKYCYLCRRPESEAGPFIRMPGNMYICNDCMQKSFDSFNNGAMQFLDLSKMPNINMSQFMPFDDIPTSQISVPFAVSSLGYGMLWNNPAVGQVTFGKNYTEWTARSTKDMDYWLTAADTPKEILENYTAVTGRAPKFPEDRMGLWQCKLRYRTQEEVLEVARRYQKEGIKIDQIVIDFFHWTVQGDWKFDEKYWPDPKAMVDELHSMGIKVIVSVWPSVDRKSENFWPMLDRGLLIKTERGALQTYDFQGDCVEIDVFNPETRKYVWEVCKKNYYDFGIDAF